MRKDTEGENRKKKIFVCEIYYCEYQLIILYILSVSRYSETNVFHRRRYLLGFFLGCQNSLILASMMILENILKDLPPR